MEEEYLNLDGFEFYKENKKLHFSAPESAVIRMDIPHKHIVNLNNYLSRVRSHVAEEKQKGSLPTIIQFSLQKYEFLSKLMEKVYGLPVPLKIYYERTLIKPIGLKESNDDDFLGTVG